MSMRETWHCVRCKFERTLRDGANPPLCPVCKGGSWALPEPNPNTYKDGWYDKMKEALDGPPKAYGWKHVKFPTPKEWNKACDAVIDEVSPTTRENYLKFKALADSLPPLDEVCPPIKLIPIEEYARVLRRSTNHSLKENTMNCENKASIRTIIETLSYQIDRAQRDATPAPVFDEEKYNAELRKAYAAHIMNENTDLNEMDEVMDKFDAISERLSKKHTKTTKVDTSKYDALRKELAAVTNIAMIQGDDAVRTNLLAIAEKIAKL